MEIIWEVDDGYMTGDRPHTLEIEDWEFADCETEDECMNLIYDYIQDEFMQEVYWELMNLNDVKEQIKDFLKRRGDEYVDV